MGFFLTQRNILGLTHIQIHVALFRVRDCFNISFNLRTACFQLLYKKTIFLIRADAFHTLHVINSQTVPRTGLL